MDAALELIARQGTAALSMRRLAAELGVEAMSLYHHVPNKTALITLMANRSLSQVRSPDPTTAWDQQLLHLLLDLYQVGVDNPTVVPALATELSPESARSDSGAAAPLVGHVVRLLQHSQLPATQQRSAGFGLIQLVIGAIVAQPPTPPEAPAPVAAPNLHRTPNDAAMELKLSIQWFLLGITTIRPPQDYAPQTS